MNTTLIKDWKWLSSGQENGHVGKKHIGITYIIIFSISKTQKIKKVRNLDKAITFNMMSRPFVCWKRAFSETFYKHAVGTKSNKILKRPAIEK